MWSSRITSGTEKFPKPRDVFASLLSQLIDKRVTSSWVHFELVSERGWFSNLFNGGQPWVEIGYGEGFLELNPGIAKSRKAVVPAIPTKCQEKKKGL